MKKEKELTKKVKVYTCDKCREVLHCMWAYNPSCMDGECIVEETIKRTERWK